MASLVQAAGRVTKLQTIPLVKWMVQDLTTHLAATYLHRQVCGACLSLVCNPNVFRCIFLAISPLEWPHVTGGVAEVGALKPLRNRGVLRASAAGEFHPESAEAEIVSLQTRFLSLLRMLALSAVRRLGSCCSWGAWSCRKTFGRGLGCYFICRGKLSLDEL